MSLFPSFIKAQMRTEADSMGPVDVPADSYWGAQTQRTLQNFFTAWHPMPPAIVSALALVKKAAAEVNAALGLLDQDIAHAIVKAADDVIGGKIEGAFPLAIWQSGSGTQSNMNMNEVLACRANEILSGKRTVKGRVHPNDHVNKGQSTNDAFPTAIHIAAALTLAEETLPALATLSAALDAKAKAFESIVKIGRTHLQDAVPMTLGQAFSGYVAQIDYVRDRLEKCLPPLYALAQGGTAVGTGLNTHVRFANLFALRIAALTDKPFVSAPNKFAALAGHEALVDLSGAMNVAATAFMKIANDVRLMASGPHCGIGEIKLPENEPGSSIMPGKVNPTQAEVMTMVAARVMGNHVSVSVAGAGGHFELNVFKPLIGYCVLESLTLLADAARSFVTHCVEGIEPNTRRIQQNLDRSLMLVTALAPAIGYDKAAAVAQKAAADDCTLKEAALALGYLDAEAFDRLVDPSQMIHPFGDPAFGDTATDGQG